MSPLSSSTPHSPTPPPPRNRYHSPVLRRFGDLLALTRGSTGAGNDGKGGGGGQQKSGTVFFGDFVNGEFGPSGE